MPNENGFFSSLKMTSSVLGFQRVERKMKNRVKNAMCITIIKKYGDKK